MTTDFSEIEAEFNRRVQRIVWCTMATVDRAGRPRTRIIHPIWEGQTGWIATGRHSLKEKHLAGNPHVSFSYWDPQHEQVYVDATAEWVDDSAEKRRVWDLFKSTPPPYGYDPATIPPWKDGPESREFGVLKLTPSRIEISSLGAMGRAPVVWRPAS